MQHKHVVLLLFIAAVTANSGYAAPRSNKASTSRAVSLQSAADKCLITVETKASAANVSEDELESIRNDAHVVAQQLIAAAADPSMSIDIYKMAQSMGEKVEQMFGDYSSNSLLEMSVQDLNFDENTVDTKNKVATLSDVLNTLSDLDSQSKGLQRARTLRNIPLIGSSVGDYVVRNTVDKMQTAASAIGVMVKSLDKRIADIESASVELNKDIERNEEAIGGLKRTLATAHRMLEEWSEARDNSQSDVQRNNLERMIKVFAERISQLQQLQMAGNALVAVDKLKIEHNNKGIARIRAVKTVSIPLTVGATVAQAATVKLERGMQTADAIQEHNNKMLGKISTDMASQGQRLRDAENRSITDGATITNVLDAVTEQVRLQRVHDANYTNNVKAVIAQRQLVIAKSESVRQMISQSPTVDPQLVAPTEFAAEAQAMVEISHAPLDVEVDGNGSAK